MYSLSIRFNLTTGNIEFQDLTSYATYDGVRGYLVVTSPSGAIIFNDEIGDDIEISTSFPFPGDGGTPENAVLGCYKFNYYVDDNGIRLDTRIEAVDYQYGSFTGCLEVVSDCLISQITSTDKTTYPVSTGGDATTVVRQHSLIPPASAPIDALAAVDASSVSRSPIYTQTWTAELVSTVTSSYSNYTVLDEVTTYQEHEVICDIDVCKLLQCVNALYTRFKATVSDYGLESRQASDIWYKLTRVDALLEITKRAVDCGNKAIAEAGYSELQSLLDCDCSCSDCGEDSREVLTITSATDGVVNGGSFVDGTLTLTRTAGLPDVVIPGFPDIVGDFDNNVDIREVTATGNGLLIEEPTDNSFTYEYAQFVRNTVFVDPKYGNDTTALAQRLDKPAKTIAHAETLALDGFTIVMAPGAYSGIAQLAASLPGAVNEIHYHFSGSSTMSFSGQNPCFDSSGLDVIKVTGPVTIDCGSNPFVLTAAKGEILVDVHKVDNCVDIVRGANGAGGVCVIRAEIVNGQGYLTLASSMFADVHIGKFNGSSASHGLETLSGYSGTSYIHVSNGSCGLDTSASLIQLGTGGESTGTVYYTGRLSDSRAGSPTNPTVLVNSGNLVVNGDVITLGAEAFATSGNSNTASVKMLGAAVSTRTCVNISGTNKTMEFSGSVSGGIYGFDITGVNSKLKCKADVYGVNAAVRVANNSTVIFQGAKLISDGTYSIDDGGTGQEIVVAGSLSADKPIRQSVVNLTPTASVVIDQNIE